MKYSILLVDDEAPILDALRRALRHEPYEILVAERAADAFRALEQHPIDVVVSDEGMPGESGTQLLTRVHASYPDTIRIMLTGQASLRLAIQAINEGHVYRFLTKPCDPLELVVAIRQALQQRALLLESRRLLHTVRRQSAELEDLEHQMRGLTDVTRDESGAIVLSDVPTDLETLLREVERELTGADAQLHAREQERRRRAGRAHTEPQTRPGTSRDDDRTRDHPARPAR